MTNGSTGSVQEDNDDDDTDDTRDDDDSDQDPKARIQALSKEAARRRRQAREWRQRAEAAEAKLAGQGKEPGRVDSADLVLAMVSAGMKPDRVKAAMRLIDPDSFDDAEDAIEELRAEHPFLFSDSENEPPKMGRTAPPMNNSRQKPGRETSQQKAAPLAKKFPVLGNRGLS